MSTGEVAVLMAAAAVAGAAAVAVLVPYLRRVRPGRAHCAGAQQPETPRNGRKPDGVAGIRLEFAADAGSGPFGPSHPPRSSAAAARRKTAVTGEFYARTASRIPERVRVAVWRELAAGERAVSGRLPVGDAFGTLFVLGVLFFAASVVALLGDYSRIFLAATLLFSAGLVGLPALKLHRIAWQAPNLSAGFYVAALEGETRVDE
ncbi:hypothetical protein [Amycolatopsis rubida]|uniref:Uncharacterized protein n=1 Tax=Amycolatopsis rubida TaxID=112413 RepID=A0A1I5XA46_9PSEU|nr:hypothetical protein [Amycolatopsis rubida]SFQ28716.1 hypothetical protein SAMN05421854_110113 [Amycolatopsis rubida]